MSITKSKIKKIEKDFKMAYKIQEENTYIWITDEQYNKFMERKAMRQLKSPPEKA